MHQATPSFGISIVGILLIASFLGLIVALIAKKKWSVLTLLVAALAGGGLWMFIGSHFELYEPQVTLAYPIPVEGQNANTTSNLNSDPTIETLWNKLTETQIKLEEVPDYTPDLIDEKGKDAIATTFGLGENESVPPAWVLAPLKSVGGVYRVSVASDPFVTEAECRRQLENELLPEVVSNRLEQLLESKIHKKVKVDNLVQFGIGTDFILGEICADEFTATVDSSVGPMKKVHVLMEFNSWVDNAIVAYWTRHESDMRLARFGKIAGLTLVGLASAWGLLRFDTYSRGYYSKQLLVGSVLAIIALSVVLLRT